MSQTRRCSCWPLRRAGITASSFANRLVYHIALEKGEEINVQLHGPRAYLQSIHGSVHAVAQEQQKQALTCGDGAFIRDEANITLVADTPLRALLIDLPV